MLCNATDFDIVGKHMMSHHHILHDEKEGIHFKATFGTSPFICAMLWNMIKPSVDMPRGVAPTHLLMALMFLKLYCSESVHATISGVDHQTFRKWSWLFVDEIARLEAEVVS